MNARIIHAVRMPCALTQLGVLCAHASQITQEIRSGDVSILTNVQHWSAPVAIMPFAKTLRQDTTVNVHKDLIRDPSQRSPANRWTLTFCVLAILTAPTMPSALIISASVRMALNRTSPFASMWTSVAAKRTFAVHTPSVLIYQDRLDANVKLATWEHRRELHAKRRARMSRVDHMRIANPMELKRTVFARMAGPLIQPIFLPVALTLMSAILSMDRQDSAELMPHVQTSRVATRVNAHLELLVTLISDVKMLMSVRQEIDVAKVLCAKTQSLRMNAFVPRAL